MDTITDDKVEALLAAPTGEPIDPEHREWMNQEIRKTLAKKERGEMEYISLDKVRKKFGLDAS